MLSVREQRYAPGLKQARHAHDYTSVTLVLAGTLQETVGGAEETARPLSLVVKPAGTPHANRMGPRGAHALQLRIHPEDAPVPGELRVWHWRHDLRASRAFLRLLALLRENGSTDLLQAAMLDALATIDLPATAAGDAPPLWIRRLHEQLSDDPAGRIPVQQLAREADVHPVYLARCFRRHYGCSVTEWLQRRRTQLAAQALLETNDGIAVVACRSGFFDQAQLCRTFRTRVGLAPSQLRRLVLNPS